MSDDHVTSILKFFYPNIAPGPINAPLTDLAGRMLYSALEKSRALDKLPTPPLTRPGPAWVLSQAIKIFWRSQGPDRIWWIAKVTVALQYRSEYELARQGIE